MNIQKTIVSIAIGTSLLLSACVGGSKVKLDSTDGVTLDGTFQEAIEGLSPSDQLKAAAGLLIFAYEGTGDETRPLDYIEEAKEEASFLLNTESGNIFQSRGSALNDIATQSGGVLNGKSAQDLIDRYNIATEQYDEYLEDQKEAKAAEEAKKAAEAEAARRAAIDTRRNDLNSMLKGLSEANGANKAALSKLKSAQDKAAAELASLKAKQKAMTGDTQPARGMQRLSNKISGRVTVIIKNTTKTPILKPIVQVSVSPKSQPGKTVMSREAGLYKFEEKKIAIAPGGQSQPMTFPVSVSFAKGSELSQGGRDFGNTDFQARLVGYETQDGTSVSLKLNPATQSILDNYDSEVAKCEAANVAIDNAKTAIPAALKKLDEPNTDIQNIPDLPSIRC